MSHLSQPRFATTTRRLVSLARWFSCVLPSSGSLSQPLEITELAAALDNPWSLAELPDGQLLITEKPGRLLRRDLQGEMHPVRGLPPVFFASQGGLLDVVLDPKFEENRWIYLSFAGGDIGSNRTTVMRA